MPFLNEAAYLRAVLASVAAQSFEHARLRLIAVDDGSSDESAEMVRSWLAQSDIRGEVVRSSARSIPRALNCGLERVPAGDYVVRLDSHALYDVDYIATIVAAFETLPADVWCVGGNCVPLPTEAFGKQLHAALFTNRMGLGAADYRHAEHVREVASVYLGAWRPGVLQRLGGYDPSWRANEDSELAARLGEAGGRVVRVPARSRNYITRGARAAIVQWSRYGYWRAQTAKRHPRTLRLRHVAPPLALCGGLALAISPLRALLLPLVAAYAAAVVGLRSPGEGPAVTAASPFYFPLVQSGFALGLLWGFISGTRRSRWPAATGPAAALQ